MKRMARVLALLAVVGVAGLAWEPGQPIPGGTTVDETSQFTIGATFVMWAEGDLVFFSEDQENVTNPAYRGTARTDAIDVYILTNTGVTISGEAIPFRGGPTGCPKALKTRGHILVKKWNEAQSNWEILPDAEPWFKNNVWFDIPAPKITGSGTIGPCWGGYFLVEIYLEVTREGYSDPAGTYTATLSMTMSGL